VRPGGSRCPADTVVLLIVNRPETTARVFKTIAPSRPTRRSSLLRRAARALPQRRPRDDDPGPQPPAAATRRGLRPWRDLARYTIPCASRRAGTHLGPWRRTAPSRRRPANAAPWRGGTARCRAYRLDSGDRRRKQRPSTPRIQQADRQQPHAFALHLREHSMQAGRPVEAKPGHTEAKWAGDLKGLRTEQGLRGLPVQPHRTGSTASRPGGHPRRPRSGLGIVLHRGTLGRDHKGESHPVEADPHYQADDAPAHKFNRRRCSIGRSGLTPRLWRHDGHCRQVLPRSAEMPGQRHL
jgi:hypothetical protein